MAESLKFFGRIEDIGFIKWTNKTQILDDQSYDAFGGFDVREAYLRGESYSVKDTLYALLEIDNQSNSFNSTMLYSSFFGVDYTLNDLISLGGIARSRNNGHKQMVFVEPFVTFSPLPKTHLTLANIFYKGGAFKPKLALQTEISQRSNTFGINLAIVNPQIFGKYYDTKMIHASLGMYLKFIKI